MCPSNDVGRRQGIYDHKNSKRSVVDKMYFA